MKFYSSCELTNWEIEAVYELLEKTPEFHATTPKENLNYLLSQGVMQVWAEPDALTPVAVMVTEVNKTQHGRFVTVLAFAGKNVDDERKLFSSIKAWAQKNGCEKIRAVCKDAQTRLFARDGFVKVANVIELELEHE